MGSKKLIFGFQSDKEKKFPILVQIALMHYICNSKCERCPVGLMNRGEMGQDKIGEFDPALRHFFSFELFKKIADEMGQFPWSILRLHGRGEPLLHPHYAEIIAYAKKTGVGTITSFTNVTLLNRSMGESILDAGLDLIELSIDAYSEELYKKFRGTDYFRQVVSNAENFIRARNKRGGSTNTRVIVSAVDCPELLPEKEAFRKFWTARADQVIFRPYHTYGGRLAPIESCQPEESVPCAQLWTRFSINPWGRVNACFNDWADDEIVGDLNNPQASISAIWQGKKFAEIRAAGLKKTSILKCCETCLATQEGWLSSYQRLIDKLQARPANHTLGI